MFQNILYVSAVRDVDFEQIRKSAPDGIIIDLEDSVPDEDKGAARRRAATWLNGGAFQGQTALRINAPDSEDGTLDLLMAADARGLDAIVVPKVTRARDLFRASRVLTMLDAPIWAMIESRAAISTLAGIARGSEKLTTVVIGYKDLSQDLGCPFKPEEPQLRHHALRLLDIALSCGLAVIDGVTVGDTSMIEQAARRARRDGFAGTSVYSLAGVSAVHRANSG